MITTSNSHNVAIITACIRVNVKSTIIKAYNDDNDYDDFIITVCTSMVIIYL